ncbi:hypothetical protein ACUS6W_18315, partial [Pseudomonas aeruginosa]|uniref:hypothetical protein n=1 Tax=Pseudomonas aeruginosa TaxID=287 RepID=UPI0040547D3B
EGVGATAAALVDLSTVAGNKISNPPWVKFQSAGWVNFPSAPTSGVPLGMADAGGGHGFCQTGVVLYRPVATRQPFVITADHGILPEPSL